MDSCSNHSPLRILLLIKSLGLGGAERQCAVLAGLLAEQGHSVRLVVYRSEDAFYKNLLPESVQLVALGCRRWNLFGLLYGLYRQYRTFNPHIMYSFMSHSNLLAILLTRFVHCRVVCGVRASGHDMDTEPLHARLGERMHRLALRSANLIIVNSNAARSELLAGGARPDKVAVVYNGVDVEKFHFDPGSRFRLRRTLGFAETDRVVGVFGRMHPMKGHAILLRAFSEAAAEDSRLKLLLIGSGDWRTLETAASVSGLGDRVVFLDQRADIEHYYSAPDLYCSASLYGEGFPNTLAEALSCGLPCIATNVGDSAIIIDAFGTLIEAGNVSQLADAIRRASFEYCASDCAARRGHIERNFSLKALAERTILSLRQALEK